MIGYVKLKLSDVDFFCRDVNHFKSDINIGEKNRMVDAKSLLSLLTLDLSQKIKVEIISDDEYELNLFADLLRRYNQ